MPESDDSGWEGFITSPGGGRIPPVVPVAVSCCCCLGNADVLLVPSLLLLAGVSGVKILSS